MAETRNPVDLVVVGLVAGLIQAATGVVMYLSGVYFAPWSMGVSVFVLLCCMVCGTLWYSRTRPHAAFSYSQALVCGVTISVFTGLVYAAYNLVTIAWIYPHFLDEVANAQFAQFAAHGQSARSLETIRSTLSAPGIAIPNLVRLSIIGSLLSLVTSIFLKRGAHRAETIFE